MTSLDGKPLIKEELPHKRVYEGPEGIVDLMFVNGNVWVSAQFFGNLHKKEQFYAAVDVANNLFEVLKEKGIKYIYCLAGSQEAFKFNEMLGWRTINLVVGDRYEIMEKEL